MKGANEPSTRFSRRSPANCGASLVYCRVAALAQLPIFENGTFCAEPTLLASQHRSQHISQLSSIGSNIHAGAANLRFRPTPAEGANKCTRRMKVQDGLTADNRSAVPPPPEKNLTLHHHKAALRPTCESGILAARARRTNFAARACSSKQRGGVKKPPFGSIAARRYQETSKTLGQAAMTL